MPFVPPKLFKFSMQQLLLDTHIIMVNGKRMSGKSTLLADILFQHRYFRKFVVMAGSEGPSGFYNNLQIPKRFVRDGFDPIYLNKLWTMQKEQQSPCCLILDDLSFDDGLWKNKDIIEIFNKGRHYKMGLIFASQYVMHVPLKLRGQVDWVFALGDNNCAAQERMQKAYFAFIPTIKDFRDIFLHFTADYGALISNCNSNHTDVTKCMYWFKATPRAGQFHIGCPEYREMYDAKQTLSKEDARYGEGCRRRNIDTVHYNDEGTKRKKISKA
jgi:hypothetical protein